MTHELPTRRHNNNLISSTIYAGVGAATIAAVIASCNDSRNYSPVPFINTATEASAFCATAPVETGFTQAANKAGTQADTQALLANLLPVTPDGMEGRAEARRPIIQNMVESGRVAVANTATVCVTPERAEVFSLNSISSVN